MTNMVGRHGLANPKCKQRGGVRGLPSSACTRTTLEKGANVENGRVMMTTLSVASKQSQEAKKIRIEVLGEFCLYGHENDENNCLLRITSR